MKKTSLLYIRFEHFLQQKDETTEIEGLKPEEQLNKMHLFIEEGLSLCLKKKAEIKEKEKEEEMLVKKKPSNFFPKFVRNLMKKKSKLSHKILKSKNWEAVEEELKKHYNGRRTSEEKKAIKALYLNPKYFYSYQKKFGKTMDEINCLEKEDGTMVTDPKEQADMLLSQYNSVASSPREEFVLKDVDDFFLLAGPPAPELEVEPGGSDRTSPAQDVNGLQGGPRPGQGMNLQGNETTSARGLEDEAATTSPIIEMIFCDWRDFSNVIDCIPGGASCGPDGILAIVLKKAKVPMARMI